MENWCVIKPLVRAVRARVIALGHLILYSSVWNPPGPIMTGGKQTKKGGYTRTRVDTCTERIQLRIT